MISYTGTVLQIFLSGFLFTELIAYRLVLAISVRTIWSCCVGSKHDTGIHPDCTRIQGVRQDENDEKMYLLSSI
jgi:hypothetical protein